MTYFYEKLASPFYHYQSVWTQNINFSVSHEILSFHSIINKLVWQIESLSTFFKFINNILCYLIHPHDFLFQSGNSR